MKYLLDTHVVLWLLSDPERIAEDLREHLAAPENLLYVSAAAVWEIAIKSALGKLKMPDDLLGSIDRARMTILPITAAHALAVADLPLHHPDPFDRIQIAQARQESLTLITRDAVLAQYDVAIVRA